MLHKLYHLTYAKIKTSPILSLKGIWSSNCQAG